MDIILQNMPAYFINMRIEGAKRKRTEEVLAESGFTQVEWIDGVRARTRTLGCALAHKNALDHALERNVFPCLIVEDDIVLSKRYDKLSLPDDIDALYLGLSEYGLHGGRGVRRHAVERAGRGLYRLYNMLAAHAIVYFNREYVEYLLRVNKIFVDMGTNQDKGRAETMKYWNVYGLEKPMFYQDGKYETFTNIELPNRFSSPLSFFYRA